MCSCLTCHVKRIQPIASSYHILFRRIALEVFQLTLLHFAQSRFQCEVFQVDLSSRSAGFISFILFIFDPLKVKQPPPRYQDIWQVLIRFSARWVSLSSGRDVLIFCRWIIGRRFWKTPNYKLQQRFMTINKHIIICIYIYIYIREIIVVRRRTIHCACHSKWKNDSFKKNKKRKAAFFQSKVASPARSNSLETNASFGAIELKLFLCCSYFCRTRKQSALTSKMCTCARKVIIPSPPQPTPLWSPANNNDLGYIYIYLLCRYIYIFIRIVYSQPYSNFMPLDFTEMPGILRMFQSSRVTLVSSCSGFSLPGLSKHLQLQQRHECIFPGWFPSTVATHVARVVVLFDLLNL